MICHLTFVHHLLSSPQSSPLNNYNFIIISGHKLELMASKSESIGQRGVLLAPIFLFAPSTHSTDRLKARGRSTLWLSHTLGHGLLSIMWVKIRLENNNNRQWLIGAFCRRRRRARVVKSFGEGLSSPNVATNANNSKATPFCLWFNWENIKNRSSSAGQTARLGKPADSLSVSAGRSHRVYARVR